MFLSRRTGMWADVDVGGAFGDLLGVFREAGPNRWRIAALAAIPPLAMFWAFAQDEVRGQPRRPEITYITSWRADRSLAEIERSNLANQRIKDMIAAREARLRAEQQQAYMAIGRATGLDVDEMKRQADAERAQRLAQQRAAFAELRKRQEDYYSNRDKR
ncbi:MAG: hypothetical protein AB7F98_00580 [Novosphingobium sp.]